MHPHRHQGRISCLLFVTGLVTIASHYTLECTTYTLKCKRCSLELEVVIYELADVARFLGIDKSRLKNWTIGRPFKVRPSVRSASGKGTRNLFCVDDLYAFAVIQHLNDAGVPILAIQGLLDKHDGDYFWKDQSWILISRRGDHFVYEDPHEVSTNPLVLDPEQKVICFYAVNVRLIQDAVQARIGGALRRRQVSRSRFAMSRRISPVADKKVIQTREKKTL